MSDKMMPKSKLEIKDLEYVSKVSEEELTSVVGGMESSAIDSMVDSQDYTKDVNELLLESRTNFNAAMESLKSANEASLRLGG